MAAAAPIIGIAGLVTQTIGGISAAGAQRRAAEASAQESERNAFLVEQQTAEAERRFRISSERALGKGRAARGASGVTLSGSALDVIAENASIAEMDAITIRQQGEAQAEALRRQAELSRQTGQALATAQGVKTLSGVLGSGSDLAFNLTRT